MDSGVFIVLYDESSLNLYLDRGVYGFLMSPIEGSVPRNSMHYHALGDYACIRQGTHIFFFLKRKVYYGGQAIGSSNYAAFYLNGQYSPLGELAKATLCWDESSRKYYRGTDKPGIFEIKINNKYLKRCQPYLIRFNDSLGLKGKWISSDELYFQLGKFPYPLPTNTISGMGFCTMTPAEVSIAIKLIKNSDTRVEIKNDENVQFTTTPIPFQPSHGFKDIHEAIQKATSEAHLEALLLANPSIWPKEIKPNGDYVLCRQVPMSPFKPPKWIDKANICIYHEPKINDGTIPNTILELKTKKISHKELEQAVKYARWLHMVLKENAFKIKIYLCGPSFIRHIENYIPDEYKQQIRFLEL